MVEDSKNLDFAIKNNYESIEPIVKYLYNENLLKKNLNVNPPKQDVGNDIAEFNK